MKTVRFVKILLSLLNAKRNNWFDVGRKIKSALQDNYGLDMINLRGQCYDGAGNMHMSGVRNGLAPRVTQEFPKTVYTWCSSHNSVFIS